MTDIKVDTTKNIQNQRRGPGGKLLPKIVDTPIKPINDAVNEAFRAIRERHPEIPNVVLVVGSSSKRALGHFAKDSWDGKLAQHEIMISGESLANGAEDVFDTLLHESAHALGEQRGIKNTSRQGRFHNKKFKALAEELGLRLPEVADKSIGWSNTKLTEDTRKLYKTQIAVLAKALKHYRVVKLAPAKPKTTIRLETKSGRKVTVPIKFHEAGEIIDFATKEVFLPVESEDGDDDE